MKENRKSSVSQWGHFPYSFIRGYFISDTAVIFPVDVSRMICAHDRSDLFVFLKRNFYRVWSAQEVEPAYF